MAANGIRFTQCYSTDFLKEHAEKHRDLPFYCYLAFTSPHFPLHALQEDIARYRDRYLRGWDAIGKERWKRQRQMGLVNCEAAPLEPDVIPSWNFSRDKLREMIGPGEADPAVPWKDLTPEQQRFQATKMAIRVGDWKLVAKGKDGPWELYDLKTDRRESKNLADQYPDKVAWMSQLWQKCEDKFREQAG